MSHVLAVIFFFFFRKVTLSSKHHNKGACGAKGKFLIIAVTHLRSLKETDLKLHKSLNIKNH